MTNGKLESQSKWQIDFLRVGDKPILKLIWESRGSAIIQSILEGDIELILPVLILTVEVM